MSSISFISTSGKTAFLLLGISLFLHGSSFGQNSEPFNVGFLRSDGILVPFAQHQDSSWQNITDEPGVYSYFQDEQRYWHAYLKDGRHDTIEVGTVVKFDPGEAQGWGMISSFNHTSVAGYGVYPIPIIGTATTKAVPLAYFSKTGNDAKYQPQTRLHDLLEQEYEKAEEDFLQQAPRKMYKGKEYINGFPIDELTDPATQDTFDLSFFSSDAEIDTARVIYFKVTKSLGRCGPELYYRGWATRESGSYTVIKSEMNIAGCDWKTDSSLEPRSLIKFEDRYFIVAVEHYYEGQSYKLFQLTNGDITSLLEQQ